MTKLKNFLSIVWASPMTLLGLLLTCIPAMVGWYTYVGVKRKALIFSVNYKDLPLWYQHRWQLKKAFTVGHVVVINCDLHSKHGDCVLLHELEHVRQFEILGIFYPMVYLLVWLALAVVCKLSNPRYSHPFELEARRVAGQVIDVEGLILKLKASMRHS